MQYRIELRNLCAEILQANRTLAGDRIHQTLAWPAQATATPAIYIAAPQDSANSNGRGPGDYTRTTTIQTYAIAAGRNIAQVQQDIETLAEQIELAIVTSQKLMAKITQISSFHSLTELSAENGTYTAAVTSVFELEYLETFPLTGPALTGAGLLLGGLTDPERQS